MRHFDLKHSPVTGKRGSSILSPPCTARRTLAQLSVMQPDVVCKELPTFKNVVIGSSALRICSWKKYARSPLQFSEGHCAGSVSPVPRATVCKAVLTGDAVGVGKFFLAAKHVLHLLLLHLGLLVVLELHGVLVRT